MAKTKISYNAEARAELSAAGRWYEERSRNAGPAFLAAVERLLDAILQFPQAHEQDDEHRRTAKVDGYPYTVVYRETTRGVRVVAVAHTSREPGYWAERV